jgi:hypothetical protein
MRRAPRTAAIILVGLVGLSSGCGTNPRPFDPGLINHVVLFKLDDPADIAELERDCDTFLKQIPSVVAYACGGHYDTGREIVDGSYDVGLYVSFKDAEGYQDYLENQDHVTLVEKWKTRWTDITIYDIENQ